MDTTIEQLLYGGYYLSIWHIEHAEEDVGIGAELWMKPHATFTAEAATVAEVIDKVVRNVFIPTQALPAD